MLIDIPQNQRGVDPGIGGEIQGKDIGDPRPRQPFGEFPNFKRERFFVDHQNKGPLF